MKKLLFFFLLLLPICVGARPVSEDEARSRVKSFLTHQVNRGKKRAATLKMLQDNRIKTALKAKDYYIFNIGDEEGFVVTAAAEGVTPILGYTDKGSFSTQRMPDGLKYWLQSMEQQIGSLQEAELEVKPFSVEGRHVIEPLLTSTWDQDYPYFLQCPAYSNSKCFTGCVATAFAQIMYYYKYPNKPVGYLPGYTTSTNQIAVPSLPGTTFKWADMTDRYSSSSSTASKNAVAELMRYCGQAFQMDYTLDYSGTVPTSQTLINYFKFDAGTRNVKRLEYTAEEWDNLIYNEIANGRPVMMDAYSFSGGHAFVLDGYDDRGLYHVNWGWSGDSNGYFLLTVLNPDAVGTGVKAANDGFTLQQDIFIGLQPPTGITPQTYNFPYCTKLSSDQTTYTRYDSNADFDVYCDAFFTNYGDADISIGKYAIGLFKDDVLVKEIWKFSYNLNLGVDETYQWTNRRSNFGASLPDGVYEIKALYALQGQTTTSVAKNGEVYKLTAEIHGNTLTITSPDNINKGLKVNSVTTLGRTVVGNAITVRVNITNEGIAKANAIYLYVNGKALTGAGVSVDPGMTGDVDLHYVATTAGENSLVISTSGREIKAIGNGSVTIYERIPANLTGTATAPDLLVDNNVKYITAPTFRVQLHLTNNTAAPYDYNLYAELYEQGEYGYNQIKSIYQPAYIEPNGQADVMLEVPGLTEGKKYMLKWYYFSGLQSVYGSTVGIYTAARTPFVYNGIKYRLRNENELEVVANNYTGNIIIPVGVTNAWGDTYGVTAVSDYAFQNCTNLLSVVLPNSVDRIGNEAFANCTAPLTLYALRPVAPLTGSNVWTNTNIKLVLPQQNAGYEQWSADRQGLAAISLTDQNGEQSFPTEMQPLDITLTRKFQRDAWNTLTLPFDIMAKDLPLYFGPNTKVAVFDTTSTEDLVKFTATQGLVREGTPLLVKPDATGDPITAVSIAAVIPQSVVPQSVKSVDGSWIFKAVYGPTMLENNRDFFIGAQNKYYLTQGSNAESLTIYGFRAYLHPTGNVSDIAAAKNGLFFQVDDEEIVTLVDRIKNDEHTSNKQIYNLHGQRLNLSWNRLPKGIYIIDGKKVLKP